MIVELKLNVTDLSSEQKTALLTLIAAQSEKEPICQVLHKTETEKKQPAPKSQKRATKKKKTEVSQDDKSEGKDADPQPNESIPQTAGDDASKKSADTTDDADTAEPVSADPLYTKDMLAQWGGKLLTIGGRDWLQPLQEVMQSLGVVSIQELRDDQFSACAQKLEELEKQMTAAGVVM